MRFPSRSPVVSKGVVSDTCQNTHSALMTKFMVLSQMKKCWLELTITDSSRYPNQALFSDLTRPSGYHQSPSWCVASHCTAGELEIQLMSPPQYTTSSTSVEADMPFPVLPIVLDGNKRQRLAWT